MLKPVLFFTMVALLGGCADQGLKAEAPLYRCERGIEFRARFADNAVALDGSIPYEVLYRDAGGVGEQQTVYSNPRARAEFGLGPDGRGAILRLRLAPLVVRCARD